MGWGNCIMRALHKDASGAVTGIDAGAAGGGRGGRRRWAGHAAIAGLGGLQAARQQACTPARPPIQLRSAHLWLACSLLIPTAELHLEGDFKKTKLKLTWLAASDECPALELQARRGSCSAARPSPWPAVEPGARAGCMQAWVGPVCAQGLPAAGCRRLAIARAQLADRVRNAGPPSPAVLWRLQDLGYLVTKKKLEEVGLCRTILYCRMYCLVACAGSAQGGCPPRRRRAPTRPPNALCRSAPTIPLIHRRTSLRTGSTTTPR